MYIYLSKLSKIFTLGITEKTKKMIFMTTKYSVILMINVQLGQFKGSLPFSATSSVTTVNFFSNSAHTFRNLNGRWWSFNCSSKKGERENTTNKNHWHWTLRKRSQYKRYITQIAVIYIFFREMGKYSAKLAIFFSCTCIYKKHKWGKVWVNC